MKKVLIYPGAFNPPHYGHVSTLEIALKHKSFDEIWIIPSGKRDDKVISTKYEDRRNMGKLFVDFLKTKIDTPIKLRTDELDNIEGKGTKEILKNIKSEQETQITQLIGLDGLLNLKKNLSSNEFEEEKFLVINRPGYELLENVAYGDNVIFLKGSAGGDISSTQIRNMIRNNDESYKELVPPNISTYIKENNLYC